MKIVTRFAPSPTGNPHVGNIRTALFAYLYAKSQKGQFLLRIEDTDRNRFVPESLEYIEESLKWLGIEYDGEKVFQSERLLSYKKFAEQLIDQDQAYQCFCTSDRLSELREEQSKKKMAPGYDGLCAKLTKKEVAEKIEAGEPHVIRLKMPKSGAARWNDLVRGEMKIEYSTQDDPIILKSDGWPTYHLANIVDDHEMGINTVIRGEEWIPSTPKHIALYECFGWEKPQFGHLPIILGPDKSKLSKRHGDTAILDYREKGYLAEAMINFLALLGWNDGSENEIYTMDRLIEKFDIHRVQKSPAVFDIEKLNWLNGSYIRKVDNAELKKLYLSLYPKEKLPTLKNFGRILEVEKSRLSTLVALFEGTEYYFSAPKQSAKMLIFKKSSSSDTLSGLEQVQKKINTIDESIWKKMTVTDLEMILTKAVSDSGLGNGDVFWPTRVALSGLEKSPSPAELLWALGKEESVKRITDAIKELK